MKTNINVIYDLRITLIFGILRQKIGNENDKLINLYTSLPNILGELREDLHESKE